MTTTDLVDNSIADQRSIQYYSNGQVHVSTTNGVSLTHTYHSNNGELFTVADSQGNQTTFENYVRGIAETVTDASGRKKELTVNDDGTINTETRFGDTQLWSYTYDKARRMINISTPDSSIADTVIEWPLLRQKVVKRADPLFRLETHFDVFGRVTAEGSYTSSGTGRWETVATNYDDLGRLEFRSYPIDIAPGELFISGLIDSVDGELGFLKGSSFRYDPLGRNIEVTSYDGAAGLKSTTEYNTATNANLQIITTDGEGNSTTHDFESFGSPSYKFRIKEKAADNTETLITRDVVGRTKKIERGGVARNYVYNNKQQLFSETHPENGTTTYEYHSNGWLNKITNNSRSITHYYQPDGQLDFVNFSGGAGENASRDYDYDPYGNLQFLKSISGSQSSEHWYTYDSENNLESETLSLDGRSFQITYSRDQLSNVSSITYPTGRVYDYAPDGFGYPTQIVSNDGKTVYSTVEYHSNGSIKKLDRSSHRMDVSLDGALRSQSRLLIRNNDGKKWGDQHFEYDKASNVSKINEYFIRDGQSSGRYLSMGYDSRNRLISTIVNAGEENGDWEFSYDAHDDIDYMKFDGTLIDYHYNTSKHLTQITSNVPNRNFQYDVHGNMTSLDTLSSTNTVINRQLTWNAADQLVALNNGTRYAYDGHGLRVKKDIGGGPIYTVYDASGKLRYREDTGAGIKSEYFYVGNDLIARRDSDSSNSSGPSSPSNFSATAYSGTAAGLSWNQTTDPTHGTALEYDLYRNGTLIHTTQNQNSYWLANGLSPGVTYSFELVAVYPGGAKSAKSNTINLLMQNGSQSY